jgi:microcystin-dependent protein
MGEPYLGEIRIVGFNFAPVGWAFCDGLLMSIGQNDALYNLIGTTYGGDGQSTFGLPNLLGRVPIHQDSGFVMGQLGGSEQVTLSTTQIPDHSHSLEASTSPADSGSPGGNLLATTAVEAYIPPTNLVAMTGESTQTGGGQPHDNMQPYLCLNFIIALAGVYPSQD